MKRDSNDNMQIMLNDFCFHRERISLGKLFWRENWFFRSVITRKKTWTFRNMTINKRTLNLTDLNYERKSKISIFGTSSYRKFFTFPLRNLINSLTPGARQCKYLKDVFQSTYRYIHRPSSKHNMWKWRMVSICRMRRFIDIEFLAIRPLAWSPRKMNSKFSDEFIR